MKIEEKPAEAIKKKNLKSMIRKSKILRKTMNLKREKKIMNQMHLGENLRTTKMMNQKAKATTVKDDLKFPTAENVSISYVPPKRFIKRYARESKKTNTDSFAKIAMKTILIIVIVSFASRFTPIIAKIKMMTNGLAVIPVKDGIILSAKRNIEIKM